MFNKIALSQKILKRLSEYSSHPYAKGIAAGATLATGYGLARSGIQNTKQNYSSFYPIYESK
jgi:hypothetical protein